MAKIRTHDLSLVFKKVFLHPNFTVSAVGSPCQLSKHIHKLNVATQLMVKTLFYKFFEEKIIWDTHFYNTSVVIRFMLYSENFRTWENPIKKMFLFWYEVQIWRLESNVRNTFIVTHKRIDRKRNQQHIKIALLCLNISNYI